MQHPNNCNFLTFKKTNMTQVNKLDYELFQYIGGHFGICKIGTYGGECVFGGDSAWEDCYDLDLIKSIYEQWDGNLIDGKITA